MTNREVIQSGALQAHITITKVPNPFKIFNFSGLRIALDINKTIKYNIKI